MSSKDFANAQDLRGKTEADLGFFIKDKEAELLKLKFQHVTGQLENTSRMQHIRREVARAQTMLGEKHRAAKNPKGLAKVASRAGRLAGKVAGKIAHAVGSKG